MSDQCKHPFINHIGECAICGADESEREQDEINELRATLAQREAQVRALRGFAQVTQERLGLSMEDEFVYCVRRDLEAFGLIDASGEPTAILRGDA